jgi:hypothetical protein
VFENQVDYGDGEAEGLAKASEARIALHEETAKDQVQDERFRDA